MSFEKLIFLIIQQTNRKKSAVSFSAADHRAEKPAGNRQPENL